MPPLLSTQKKMNIVETPLSSRNSNASVINRKLYKGGDTHYKSSDKNKNTYKVLNIVNTSFGKSANRNMDISPPVLTPGVTLPSSPQSAKDPNEINKSMADDYLNESEDSDTINDEILKTVNELFDVPTDDSMDLPPLLSIPAALESSRSFRYSGESLINHIESERPNSQGNKKDPEVNIVNPSSDNFIAEKISKVVDFSNMHYRKEKYACFDSQSSSGTETDDKDQHRSSNGVVHVQRAVGFSDRVSVTSEELDAIMATSSEGRNPNRKGNMSTLLPMWEEIPVEISNDSYENTDDKVDDSSKRRLNMNGHNGNRSNSPSSSSSSDDVFLPVNMSKALKDKRKMKTRQIGVDIDEEQNPVTNESEKDSELGSSNSDLSDDEGLSLEALKKLAARFLTKDVKQTIFREEKKRKKSSSEDSDSDSSGNTKKEKYKRAKKSILNNAAIEISLEVDKKHGRPKMNLDRAESKEDKEKVKPGVKKRGRKSKKLELYGEQQYTAKIFTKEPAKSLKRSVQFESSKSDSEVESQNVAYNITKKCAEIPKKRPSRSTAASKSQSPAKKLRQRASIKPLRSRSNINVEFLKALPDVLVKNKAISKIRPRTTSVVTRASMKNLPKKVSKMSSKVAKLVKENVQIKSHNFIFNSIVNSQKVISSVPMKKKQVPKKRRGRLPESSTFTDNSEITSSKKRKLCSFGNIEKKFRL